MKRIKQSYGIFEGASSSFHRIRLMTLSHHGASPFPSMGHAEEQGVAV
jgi:hypothetical protein